MLGEYQNTFTEKTKELFDLLLSTDRPVYLKCQYRTSKDSTITNLEGLTTAQHYANNGAVFYLYNGEYAFFVNCLAISGDNGAFMKGITSGLRKTNYSDVGVLW
jgi:hypothetical protein